MNRVGTLLGAGVAVGVVGAVLGYAEFAETRYRNFKTVEPGKLYRSGQLDEAGFEQLVREYGIRTVITFRDARKDGEPAPDLAEEDFCKANGIVHVRLSPRRWGSVDGGPPPVDQNVREFLKAVEENRGRGPILIHCFAGVHRTGAYTAIYRMEFNKWSNADAVAEMFDLGYTTLESDPDIQQYLDSYVPRWSRPGAAALVGGPGGR